MKTQPYHQSYCRLFYIPMLRAMRAQLAAEIRRCEQKAIPHAIAELQKIDQQLLALLGYKYNHNHDSEGRFSGGGEGTGANQSRLTVETNKIIHIHHSDGSTETREGGSRAWRNNNPGNIIAGDFAMAHGAIGNNHGFAVFPDEATGDRASIALLRTHSYASMTIDAAIARRSPPAENDTLEVQRSIRNIGKFSGNEVIGSLSDEQLTRLTDAIKKVEQWKVGSVTRK